jgi:hypothetical protein
MSSRLQKMMLCHKGNRVESNTHKGCYGGIDAGEVCSPGFQSSLYPVFMYYFSIRIFFNSKYTI